MRHLKYLIIVTLLIFSSCDSDEQAPIASQPDQFNLLWEFATPSFLPQGIIVDVQSRNYIYVASKSGGVQVFDNSSNSPSLITSIPITDLGGHHAMHLTQEGDFLYVALGDFFGGNAKAGIAIIDVSDPNNPCLLYTSPSPRD